MPPQSSAGAVLLLPLCMETVQLLLWGTLQLHGLFKTLPALFEAACSWTLTASSVISTRLSPWHLPERDFHMMLFKWKENVRMGFQRARQVYKHVATHSGGEGNLQQRKNAWRRQDVIRMTSYNLHFQGTKATRWLKCTLSLAQRAPTGLGLDKLKPIHKSAPKVPPAEKKKNKISKAPRQSYFF